MHARPILKIARPSRRRRVHLRRPVDRDRDSRGGALGRGNGMAHAGAARTRTGTALHRARFPGSDRGLFQGQWAPISPGHQRSSRGQARAGTAPLSAAVLRGSHDRRPGLDDNPGRFARVRGPHGHRGDRQQFAGGAAQEGRVCRRRGGVQGCHQLFRLEVRVCSAHRPPPAQSGAAGRGLTREQALHPESKVLGIVSADLDKAAITPAELSGILVEAGSELALLKSDDIHWTKNPASAAQWITRLVQVWRELVSRNRPTAIQDSSAPSPAALNRVLELIDGFLTVFAARVPQVVRDHERQAAIEKAKHEWEFTADALTAIVCLLNSDGWVLRANRVVEHWGLGSVIEVIGKSAHAMLHPDCADPNCAVARGLQAALPKLRGGEPQEFEFYSPSIDQTLQFTLRPMRAGDDMNTGMRDARSVLVVTDVSALRRAQKALENVNLNLESRVRLRTRELNESNRDLRNEVARREHAEHELRASRNNLALLSEQLIQAQEVERRRIALELHDSVGQSLSAIKYTLERAIIMIQRGNLGSPESVLTLAVQRIHETADGIRAISMNLRPQMLDNLGAASATSWFCRGFAEIYPTLT